MTNDEPEPNFSHDVEEMQDAVTEALNALTDVKAYTLQADELHDYKAAQYALRNLCDDMGMHDVEGVYEDTDYGDRR